MERQTYERISKHMKILFAVPMSTNDACVKKRGNSLEKLKFQCELNGIDYRIMPIQSDEGIATKVNRAIDTITDEDYFCFIHDDMFVMILIGLQSSLKYTKGKS